MNQKIRALVIIAALFQVIAAQGIEEIYNNLIEVLVDCDLGTCCTGNSGNFCDVPCLTQCVADNYGNSGLACKQGPWTSSCVLLLENALQIGLCDSYCTLSCLACSLDQRMSYRFSKNED
jgi:hypothetical protein